MIPIKNIVLVALCLSVFVGVALFQQSTSTTAGAAAEGPMIHWVFDSTQIDGKTLPDRIAKRKVPIPGANAFIQKPTSALELKDANTHMIIDEKVNGKTTDLPQDALTVMAWVRLDETTRYGGILGVIQDNGDYERGWILGYDETHFTFALAAQPEGKAQPRLTYLRGKNPFVVGKWYHVAGTYDGKTMRLFVNGKEENQSTEQSGKIAYAPSAPFVMGRYLDQDEDYPMFGAIHEIQLFPRALQLPEITERFAPEKVLAELPAPPVQNRFVINPYLQFATPTTMTVMWETLLPGTTKVEYGPKGVPSLQVEEKNNATIHEIVLRDLNPETNYVYRVSTTDAEGRTLTGPLTPFMTAVKPDSAFSFAVVGDTQNNPKMTGIIAKRIFERRPHFVVHCGDVVEVGPTKRLWVQELFGPCSELFSQVPVFPTIGNHERNHANYYNYFSLPKPEYHYQYRYGNADFFSIDSNKPLKPGTEQYQWLEEKLSKSDATWKFVYHHHPAWSSDSDDYGDTKKGIGTLGDLNVRNLVTLYEKYNVDMAFNGHIHMYERTWPIREGKVNRKTGVTYVTSGGGGGKLEDSGPLPAWFKAQLRVDFHHLFINIHGNKMEFKAFDQQGQLFDSFDREK